MTVVDGSPWSLASDSVLVAAPGIHTAMVEALGEGELTMRITMLGATGGTGRQLVSQALQRGHQVDAVVRDPAPAGRQPRPAGYGQDRHIRTYSQWGCPTIPGRSITE